MTNKDYKFFKQQYKQGNKVTIILDKMASTGEIASTNSSFKAFKQDVKRYIKEGIRLTFRVKCNKRILIQAVSELIEKIEGNDALIEQIRDKIFDLSMDI